MKITIAETAGFCMGVKRAVDLAVETTNEKLEDIYTIGPLIHNEQALATLKSRGVQTISDKIPLPKDSTIITRAHGIPPELEAEYKAKYDNIIDATCPKVKTVHKVIEKYKNSGYEIIITGDDGHAEVIGLLGYAKEKGHLIRSVDDLEKLPHYDKVCLVSQTTFGLSTFDKIKNRFLEKYSASKTVVKKTICAATDKRQTETTKMAREVDALIVVGGKHSANTIRLALVGKENNTPTFHIEEESELKWKDIAEFDHIGITAGASTPNWMIKRVADHINYLAQKNRKEVKSKLLGLANNLAYLNFFVSIGGVAMYYTSSIFQNKPFTKNGAVLSYIYIMCIYLWNSLTGLEKNKHLDIARYKYYIKYKVPLTLITVIGLITIVVQSFMLNRVLFYLTLFLTTAGTIYSVTIVPKFLQKVVKYSNLKDIPTSRDLFAAMAWAVLITFLPHALTNSKNFTPETFLFFILTFLLVYFRSLIFDMRDIEGDRIMGRETLVTVIGEKRSKKLITAGFILSVFLIGGYSTIVSRVFNNNSIYSFLFELPVILYGWIILRKSEILKSKQQILFSMLIDGMFYLMALGAFISTKLHF